MFFNDLLSFQPRKHFGINKTIPGTIPKRIEQAMIKSVGEFPMKKLLDNGEVFNRFIKTRKAPVENMYMKQKVREIQELVMQDPAKYKLPKVPESDSDELANKAFDSRLKQKVKEIVKQRVYSWQSIKYDNYKALLYLMGRSSEEYAVIMKIFNEIKRRDPQFIPRSFFDFGSGVGTGTWAVSETWEKSIYEYYLVDTSREMNDLSDLILRDGDANKNHYFKNVNHRQFLPSRDDKYDIVLSAYSLLELPSLKSRLEVVNNLWHKAGKYLVFAECGTNAGFQVLNEVRDFLIELTKKNDEKAFVFAPCPHESPCPRFSSEDGTPCNFNVAFHTLPLSGPSMYKNEVFSYLVFKKGEPVESDRWPRIVRTPINRHKHTICQMCTNGVIKEGIFTAKKHGKFAYRCANKSSWGDQLPINIIQPEIESTEKEETIEKP